MARFFVEQRNVNVEDAIIVVTGTDVNHIKNVLRLPVGEKITLCGDEGTSYKCEIHSFGPDFVKCHILSVSEESPEPIVPVILLQGVAKGERLDLVVQKGVELGVSEIIPVITERTVVRFENDKDKKKKVERWQRIAMEASKQSGRTVVPVVEDIVSFDKALELSKDSTCRLIPYEKEYENTLKSVIGGKDISKFDKIYVFIGPEGGFSEEEVKKAVNSGFTSVSLGKRILRTETAGPTVIAQIRYELGD